MKSEEIAKLAGVSRSTVSRVINHYPNVPEETRIKVMKVINEYHYTPNTFARTLAGKKSNTIGLFLFIDGWEKDEDRIYKNDFFGSYLDLLVDYANLKDYYILVSIISEKAKYRKIQQAFMEKRIDAGIIIGTQVDTLKEIHMDSIHSSVVLFDYDLSSHDQRYRGQSQISTINSHDYQGIQDAVKYLYDKGHRRIGFIKGREQSRSGRLRLKAFEDAMVALDMELYDGYMIPGDFTVDLAYTNIKQLIKTEKILPTAIISANDFMALAAIEAFREAGIMVPQDISIIGFDNTLHGQISDPKLTTIGPDFRIMAEKAIDILDQQIQDHYPAEEIIYPVNFYERETCKSIPL